MSRHALGLVLLIFVTAIWGSTFAIVKSATETLSPATLIAWRFTIAALVLLPFLFSWPRVFRRDRRRTDTPKSALFWKDGLLLGSWLIIGYATQTIGLQTTSANRAAFITGLNVVMVPLWLAITAGAPLRLRLWGAVVLALLGIGLLSWEGGALVIGDLWAFGCALSYAGYILALEKAAPRHPPLAFTAAQVIVVALFGWLWALLAGGVSLAPASTWGALIYLGLAATAVTTLLQTLGQRWVSATEAAIIYALEPVAASIFSFFLLRETVGARGFAGGALVVAAMILSQLPERGRKSPPGAVGERGLAE
ncbi:DMT family transporter [Deinococcus peraridilitoris]|nr:DMT family transporter [Deinococcus peraridilitoris]